MFPAHAGMDRDPGDRHAGDAACSPHTRGWTEVRLPGHSAGGRAPRTRGDGPIRQSEATNPMKCSPHTRGWTG